MPQDKHIVYRSQPYQPHRIIDPNHQYSAIEYQDAFGAFATAVAYSTVRNSLQDIVSNKNAEIAAGIAYGAAMFAITRNPTSIILPAINTFVNYIATNSIEKENNKTPEQKKAEEKAASRRYRKTLTQGVYNSTKSQDFNPAQPIPNGSFKISTIKYLTDTLNSEKDPSKKRDPLFSYMPNPGQVVNSVTDSVINNQNPGYMFGIAYALNYAGTKVGGAIGGGINCGLKTLGEWTGLISEQKQQQAHSIGFGDEVANPLYKGRKI
jgi:hypothetical protein